MYDYIDECETYHDAVASLEALFVKKPNEVFARHLLATARQQPGQSLDEFLQRLRRLSKDCNFCSVSAEKYRKEMVRDAFINGLISSVIRQRLLENQSLSLESAFNQACSIDVAQKNSRSYELEPVSTMASTNSEQAPTSNSYDSENHATSSVSRSANSAVSVEVAFFTLEGTALRKVPLVINATKRNITLVSVKVHPLPRLWLPKKK